MALVSLRAALSGGPGPATGTPPASSPPPVAAPPEPSPWASTLNLGAAGPKAYSALAGLFPNTFAPTPFSDWLATLLTFGGGVAGAPSPGVGVGRGLARAVPQFLTNPATARQIATWFPSAAASPVAAQGLASAMSPGMAGGINAGLAAAQLGASLSGNQTAAGLMTTLGSAAAYAMNPASALMMFAVPGDVFNPRLTEQQSVGETMEGVPAFGLNRIGDEARLGEPVNLGSLGNLAALKAMAGANYRNDTGHSTKDLYDYGRNWMLANVLSNPYGVMHPRQAGEAHEAGYGITHQVPAAFRTPQMVGQLLDDDLDFRNANTGGSPYGVGFGIDPDADGRLQQRILRYGTLGNLNPSMTGEQVFRNEGA